eukprot:SAG11_NODE_2632_length_3152_cov_1.729774_2_plen_45_part_00
MPQLAVAAALIQAGRCSRQACIQAERSEQMGGKTSFTRERMDFE